MTSGSLTIAGTGIKGIYQTTSEARTCITESEKVLYLVTDPVTETWIKKINSTAESLMDCYDQSIPRIRSYYKMVDRILSHVRNGLTVCAVFYGHPGVFVFPSHEAIRQARDEGYPANMIPGISAEDCLFADLGIDPGQGGCQSYEATDFLIHRRKFDTTVSLILWQIGVIGNLGYNANSNTRGLRVLVDILAEQYGLSYEVIVYEAVEYFFCSPRIQKTSIQDLVKIPINSISTLYVPPLKTTYLDNSMVDLLKIDRSVLHLSDELRKK